MSDEAELHDPSPGAGPDPGDADTTPAAADPTAAAGTEPGASVAETEARTPDTDAIEKINNAADHFFKLVMSVPQNIASLLAYGLPPELSAELDLTRLEAEPTTYVNAILQERTADFFWRTHTVTGNNVIVHLHIEHQSDNDPLMSARNFVYDGMLTSSWMRANTDATRVPAIVNVVIHQGKGRWRAPVELLDVIDLPPGSRARIARWLPKAEYVLLDLADIAEHALNSPDLALAVKVWIKTVKAVRDHPAPVDELLSYAPTLRELRRQPGGEVIADGSLYFVHSSGKEPLWRLRELAEEAGMTSMMEVFAAEAKAESKAEGRAEGKAEGRAEGKAEMLLELLDEKFGSLPGWVSPRVNGGSADDLKTWGKRLLTAATLEDVFR